MRAIAELPHPECKITIFLMNQKYLIKFEKGAYEQTYKLSQLDLADGVNSVFQIIDENFIDSVVKRFEFMKNDFKEAWLRFDV